jgi:dihydropteroate synthase
MTNKIKIMGILNITPDSFSDGGIYNSLDAAIQHGLTMIEEGADIIDIGGESTRPYAKPVSVQEELDRVIPVLEELQRQIGNSKEIYLSVDTSKPEVIKASIIAGARMINDIRAFSLPDALAHIANNPNIKICLGHTPAEPSVMQDSPYYNNVTQEVCQFLQSRIEVCIAAGIPKNNIIADPGIGFGKTTEHNIQLLNQLETFQNLGVDILIGVSRKAWIGDILKKSINKRLYGGLAAAVLAVSKGARIIRTHDVRPTVEALAVAQAILA